MAAYYNEFDPYAAQWLRNLIAAGHIAPGDVDERSIEDVRPNDLRGYAQCHFFAGIGVWSLALRRAGWPDDRQVWTGSCPCQPFSSAGAGAGFEDPRHLWPTFAWLIKECRPSIVIGEQVASKAVGPWVDSVHTDMEAMAYAFGAIPFPSAGVGAPHIRDRLFWVGDSDHAGLEGLTWHGRSARWAGQDRPVASPIVPMWLADTESDRYQWAGELDQPSRRDGSAHLRANGGMADANMQRQGPADNASGSGNPCGSRQIDRPGPVNGAWGAADWLGCRDGKWRAVEPGTFPLAHGAASRVGRLRAYGNAINVEAARIFIESIGGILAKRSLSRRVADIDLILSSCGEL